MQLGPRHVQLMTRWMPTAMVYGASATLALLYFTEWKAVLKYVPLYNRKYDQN